MTIRYLLVVGVVDGVSWTSNVGLSGLVGVVMIVGAVVGVVVVLITGVGVLVGGLVGGGIVEGGTVEGGIVTVETVMAAFVVEVKVGLDDVSWVGRFIWGMDRSRMGGIGRVGGVGPIGRMVVVWGFEGLAELMDLVGALTVGGAGVLGVGAGIVVVFVIFLVNFFFMTFVTVVLSGLLLLEGVGSLFSRLLKLLLALVDWCVVTTAVKANLLCVCRVVNLLLDRVT